MYQHDDAHTARGCSGLSPLNAASLRPDWFVSTPGAVTAEPTVADNTVFVGDSTGQMHAVSATSGASDWTFAADSPQSCYLDQPDPYTDHHRPGFGSITSSASFAASVHADGREPGAPTLYFAGGDSLFALDAFSGRCDWAVDLDPGSPADALEAESSPLIDTGVSPPEVIIGTDDNSSSGIGVTGIQAFNAITGALLWRYEPERDVTLYASEFGGNDGLALSCGDGSPNDFCNSTDVPGLGMNSRAWADACGDVWSSPALDPSYTDPAGDNTYESVGPQASVDPVWQPKQITSTGRSSHDGLVLFGTGNCQANPAPSTTFVHEDYSHTEGVFGLDPVTGIRVWNWFEPPNLYNNGNPNERGAGDDDFGGSAIVASVPNAEFPSGASACPAPIPTRRTRGTVSEPGTTTNVVIQGGKSGYAYGLCESTGRELWGVQAVEPGELGNSLVGSIGGFIGSPSLGQANGRTTAFFDAAVPLPFAGNGIRQPGSGDDAGDTCPDLAVPGLPLLPACVDPSLATNPQRLLAVQAVDAATGGVTWRTLAGPSYAATSYSNGVVFVPSTSGFSARAYDADTGLPLWQFPLGAAPASGTSIVGSAIFLGSGISEGQNGSTTIPPGANGIWSFSLGTTAPTVGGLL
jgi:outer membrane protein assembly factor BamB